MSPAIPTGTMMPTSQSLDVEKNIRTEYTHLTNQSVHSFSWEGVTVTVKDRHSKQPLELLHKVNGTIKAGMFSTTHCDVGYWHSLHRRNAGSHGSQVNLIVSLAEHIWRLLVALARQRFSTSLLIERPTPLSNRRFISMELSPTSRISENCRAS
jgi:hypothetical protein